MYQNKDTMRRPERQAADAGGSVLQSAAEPYRAHMCHGNKNLKVVADTHRSGGREPFHFSGV